MDEARFTASLVAKVDVGVQVAAVFGQEPLDFALLFSSVQSFGKAPGQSNYAAGCTFADAHAHAWHSAGRYPVKVVNWGYWADVGVVATPEHRARMARMGMGSVTRQAAMRLIEDLLAAPLQQVAFVTTTKEEVAQSLGVDASECLVAAALGPSLLNQLEMDNTLPDLQKQSGLSSEELQVQVQSLDAVLARILLVQLNALGLLAANGTNSIEANHVCLAPVHQRWLEHSLQLLEQHGHLRREGAVLSATRPVPDMTGIWSEWESYKAALVCQYPWQRAHLDLLDICILALPDVLHGRKAATEVLFPRSSMDRVSSIYAGHPVVDHFNKVLAQSLLAIVRNRLEIEPTARFRLLEIGAGTGATSACLFKVLEPYAHCIEEYCYSDISKAFLLHAEERYRGQATYLRTQLFNVESALEAQGFVAGSYDLVIATNVLHATRDIRESLRNAKALLRSGGVLLLNEMSTACLSSHLSFGLLEGWWLAQDIALRFPGSPALAPATWRELLFAEGFVPVLQPRSMDHVLGQQIVLAQSDGWLRKRTADAPASAGKEGRRSPVNQTPDRRSAGSDDLSSWRIDTGMQGLGLRLPQPQLTEQRLVRHVREIVVDAIAQALKMDRSSIEQDRSFAEYGVDFDPRSRVDQYNQRSMRHDTADDCLVRLQHARSSDPTSFAGALAFSGRFDAGRSRSAKASDGSHRANAQGARPSDIGGVHCSCVEDGWSSNRAGSQLCRIWDRFRFSLLISLTLSMSDVERRCRQPLCLTTARSINWWDIFSRSIRELWLSHFRGANGRRGKRPSSRDLRTCSRAQTRCPRV